jgi:sortase system peptidoglycan-associated protein
MIKQAIAFTLIASSVALGGNAAAEETSRKGLYGMGSGALAGALLGGPLGAGIGAIVGVAIGETANSQSQLSERAQQFSAQVDTLESQLADSRRENGSLRSERQQLRTEVAQLAELRQSSPLSGKLALDVLFRTGSDQLEPTNDARLAELGTALKAFPNLQITLEGHADQRGPEDANLALSAQRTEAVKQALIAAGVPAERIDANPLGESRARAARGDADGLALDRRVSIQLQLKPQREPREHALNLTL